DREMLLGRRSIHRPIEPLDLVRKRDRISRLERAHDVRIVHPAIAAFGVLALERAQDHVLPRDHEAPPPRPLGLGRKRAFRAVGHPAADYRVWSAATAVAALDFARKAATGVAALQIAYFRFHAKD